MAQQQPDIVGMFTGISSKPIDPAVRAGNDFRRAFAGMFGKETREVRQQRQLADLIANFDTMQPAQQRQTIAQLQAVGQTDLAKQLAAKAQSAAEKSQLEVAKQAEIEKERNRRTAFSTFLANKYPNSGLDKLAAQGIVTPKNFNDFLKDKQDANAQKGTTFTVQDANGDNFTATSVFNPNTGKTDVSYSPIGATKSQQPVGKVQITGGEFGLTAQQDLERNVSEAGLSEKEKTYQETRTKILDSLPTLNASRANLERASRLLERVDTGGPINVVATGLENFFGVKSANKAELQILLGQEMYKSLKPLFGGVISDPERQAIEAIYAGLEKGNLANEGILRKLKRELDDSMLKAAIYLNADTSEDYDKALKQMFPVVTKKEEQENIIDFGDLDNVSNPKR